MQRRLTNREMLNGETVRRSWECGRHSGFPLCCIVWYILRAHSGWVALVHNRYWYQRWLVRSYRADPIITHQYVRCPLCKLRGRWVEMHLCDASCENVIGMCRTVR